MLYKKGSPLNLDNYRPIALINIIAKIFTQILAERINSWVRIHNLLPEFQAGFRSGRGCLDHIFVLNSLIQLALNARGGKVFALFVDFRRAFPSVNHNLLWRKLHNFGISNKIIEVLMNLYSKAKIRIRNASGTTEEIDVMEGVLQGEVLSPILFAIFLADLEDFLKKNGIRGINIGEILRLIMLAYAYDIVLLALTIDQLKSILKVLFLYCTINLLTLNTDKTKIVVFKKGGRNIRNLSFTYGDKELEIVKKYTYLGVTFDSGCSMNEAASERFAGASSAIRNTLALIFRAKLKSWKSISGLFDSLVKSTLLFSFQVWSLRHMDVLERVQNVFFKRILGLPVCT